MHGALDRLPMLLVNGMARPIRYAPRPTEEAGQSLSGLHDENCQDLLWEDGRGTEEPGIIEIAREQRHVDLETLTSQT